MTAYNSQPNTTLSQQADKYYHEIQNSDCSILVGPNNCGKSYLLTKLQIAGKVNSTHLSVSRYHNFEVLEHRDGKRIKQYHTQFFDYALPQPTNLNNLTYTAAQLIPELTNDKREILFQIMAKFLGVEMSLRYIQPDNILSQPYISVNGHNISFASTGTRLLATVFAFLLNQKYEQYLIDEPELGLSPVSQRLLASLIIEEERRAEYFPHVKRLVIATHSNAFLDRRDYRNNYFVTKQGDEISIRQAQAANDLHDMNFFLLGNRFEDWSLPSLLVVVEGDTDRDFISVSLRKSIPDRCISVIPAKRYMEVSNIVDLIGDVLSDMQTTPYKNRIVVVADSQHENGLRQKLENRDIVAPDLVIWSQNGIEHFYPPKILDEIFGAGGELTIDKNEVSRNGKRYSKKKLCSMVIERITPETEHQPEFESFLTVVKNKLS